MTHSPPIPDANKSPYPIQEPPHVHKAEATIPVRKRDAPTEPAGLSGKVILLGAALGLGALAIAAAVFEHQTRPPVPRKRRKAPKRSAD